MALGLILLGAGFVVLVLAALANAEGALVSPLWLCAAFFLHTAGELCLSPVGLAFVTRIAPVSMAAMLMGVWFLSSFAANLMAGYLAGMLEAVERGDYFRVFGGQADFFLILVLSSLVAGALLLVVSGRLRRWIEGRGWPPPTPMGVSAKNHKAAEPSR
jgi:POT family proton-dependent oligopeptide transporter